MDYTTLGDTGLRVSVAGLGTGGSSRIGAGRGLSADHSVALVHEALTMGVTFFDTAQIYGTEELLGRALGVRNRDDVVICTKGHAFRGGAALPAADVVANLEQSLRNLRTERVDVFMLHAVEPAQYAHVHDRLLPALLVEQDKGKIRHLGVSEKPPHDPSQEMLQRALADGTWPVVMLAFHMMNQGPRRTVLPLTRQSGVGTVVMFAVRSIFSNPQRLRSAFQDLAREGVVSPELAELEDPLGFLVHEAGARSLQDAAYRFARYEPGVDVVLFGTSSVDHLRANVRSILAPPLPASDRERLYELFGHLIGVGLDTSDRSGKPH